MVSLRQVVIASVGLLGFALAVDNATVPIAPSQDPWYSPPDGWEAQAPGAVLRVRTAPGNISTTLSGASGAFNILYRTTNSLDQASWAVTTLYIPNTPNSKALISYQPAYDSHFLDDSPSYAIYQGFAETAAMAPCLALGWYLNVPDYEGPNASFTAGMEGGYAIIDSVRAVFNLKDKFGIAADAKYAMWGYSGGGMASEWAAELQTKYAPEMNFSGAALGGLHPNVTDVLYHITGTPEAGLAFSAAWGMLSQHPGAWDQLLNRMKKCGRYNATTWTKAVKMPVNETSAIFYNQDLAKYFKNGFSWLSESFFSDIWNKDGIMGQHGKPNMPLYVYKAINDQVSPINETDALVQQFCGDGVNILYERNTVGGHTDEGTNGAYAAFFWLNSIFSGTYSLSYNATGCTIRDVTSNYTDTGV